MKGGFWGKLLSIDLRKCKTNTLKDKKKLVEFCYQLCNVIKMKRFGEPIIHHFGKGKLKGYSLIQFIETSSITAHFDERGSRAFIDIFSCKDFDEKAAITLCKKFFSAKDYGFNILYRF